MHPTITRALERLRQPAYTGENRCVPCTAVNLVIAAVLAVGAGVFFPPAGGLVFLVSVLAIYFRGYLVPGTPTLTKRYFPDWLLAKFDKAPEGYGLETEVDGEGLAASADEAATDQDPDSTHGRERRVSPEQALLSAGVVEPCADEDDLCLVADVREAWRAAMDDVIEGRRRQQVAHLLDADAETVAVNTGKPTDHVVVRLEGRVAARWESEGALIADIAGMDVLAERVPDWETYPIEQRSQLAGGLRAFLEQCPTCGGAISIDAETVESCCRSYEVYAITCNDCDARLLEVDA